MKTKLTLVAVAIGGLMTGTMRAQITAHTTDNIYAGFWRVDAEGEVARNYVAAIGLRSTLASQSPRTVLASLGSDLSTVFGNNWYSDSTDTGKVYWGVFGWNAANASTTSPLLGNYFIGVNELGNSTISTDISGVIRENLSAALGTANSGYSSFGTAYDSLRQEAWDSTAGTGGLTVGVGMTANTDSFAYNASVLATPWQVGGLSSSYLEAWVGDQDNGGKAGDLSVYGVTRRANSSDLVNNSGLITQGMLTIESNGQVMVIPEPSTYALFGFGLLLMVVAYRRKVSA
jgi:hypothetical protein